MSRELPSADALRAAVAKIKADFKSPSVSAVKLSVVRGAPVVAVLAVSAKPDAFPRAVNVRLPSGALYPLPIIWQNVQPGTGVAQGYFGFEKKAAPVAQPTPQQDRDIDLDMWAGATPVVDKPVTLWEPGRTPDTPVLGDIPPTDEQNFQMAVGARLPQFVEPNFWSIPFDQSGVACPAYYERWYTAYTFTVPSDRMVIVTGISYEVEELSPFDQFQIMVNREASNLAIFSDMRALNTADPAEEYVLAGHYRPLPFYGRFDHDQRIVVRVKVRGAYPFTHTPQDTFGGCAHVFLTGWMASLIDNRDGGARPIDMGDLNHLALGIES